MKKITLTYCPIIVMMFLFSGCSWQEYFQIINETSSDITIEYKIENPVGGFAIFENHPSVYQLNSSNNVDWDNQLSIIDKDTALLVIRLTLPAKSTTVFGHLSNDRYEKYNQNFINGRVFNLTNLSINNNQNTTLITPINFDNYFKKENGNIVYRIK